MNEYSLHLEDGRVVAFTVQGSAGGWPVFYLHGVPGSRREPVCPPARTDRQLRVIALDRPGYGGSTPNDGYTLADHAGDIAAVADHLGLGDFSLFGFSGGGVFAMACAARLGRRVRRLVLAGVPVPVLLDDPLAGTGELNGAAWRLARQDHAALLAMLRPLAESGGTLRETMLANLPPVDRDLLTGGENAVHYRDNMAAAVAGGADIAAAAMARDLVLLLDRWDFDPASLTQPAHVFHGGGDELLSDLHARTLAAVLPECRLEIARGRGHYAAVYGAEAAALWRQALPEPECA